MGDFGKALGNALDPGGYWLRSKRRAADQAHELAMKRSEGVQTTSTVEGDLETAAGVAAERAALANDQRRAAAARQQTTYSPLGVSTQANLTRKTLTGT